MEKWLLKVKKTVLMIVTVFLVQFGLASAVDTICDWDNPTLTLVGNQERLDTRDSPLPAGTVIDATDAVWYDVHAYPILLNSPGSICWLGGRVEGNENQETTPWTIYASRKPISLFSPNSVIQNSRLINYGDAIIIKEGADNFVLRSLYVTDMHDDCVENDQQLAGTIDDSLLDGCYMAFSTRTSSSDTDVDGSGNLYTIKDSLIYVKEMSIGYGGEPGNGAFFKYNSHDDRGPDIALHNNIFRIDEAPHVTSQGLIPQLGKLVDCSNNTMIWLGNGDFPLENDQTLPDCFTLTNDVSLWENAKSDWLKAHGYSGGGIPLYQCNDGIDNDGDGETDYPDDPGCLSDNDNSETNCGDGVCIVGENCSTCPADCGICTVVCVHDADQVPCDGCIDTAELSQYVGLWKSGSVEMGQMMSAVGMWKNGC